MEKVSFPYRSSSHLQLLHVIAESGAWEKHGLEVEYDRRISSNEGHQAVLNGDVDFVGGNHVSPYGYRARGDRWVYLGQTVNIVPGRKLVVRPDSDITCIDDLRNRVIGSKGRHPHLNDWLQLKQNGLDIDRDQVGVVRKRPASFEAGSLTPVVDDEDDGSLWRWVLDGTVEAAFVPAPQPFFARRAGLKVIDIPDLAMIYFTTISSSLRFTEQHPDIVDRFLKGMIEGIHFFKTQPERTIGILKDRYRVSGLMDDEIAGETYRCLAAALEPKLYPSTAAIANVYEEGVRQDADALRINPMALWDLHFLRRIDDSGFVDELYS